MNRLTLSRKNVLLFCLGFSVILETGCNNDSKVVELHLPRKINQITIEINSASGQRPRTVGRGVVAIDFDQEGVAKLRSIDVLNTWHQKIIVIDGKSIADFYLGDRKVVQNQEKTALENGAVKYTSKTDGSRLQYEVVYNE